MKVLLIGGNRYVGLRLAHSLALDGKTELHIANRTGQAPHAPGAIVYKADRNQWQTSHVDRDFDAVVDFACFHDEEARETIQYFKSIKRYIFVSTGSVYDEGGGRKEEDFAPSHFDLNQPRQEGSYQDGKRRAEAAFTQLASFPTVSVRFPFILGPDDYTRRLEFHVERVEQGKPLYIPNLKARVSMIHAEDACRFLQWSLDQSFSGPLNVCSPEPISLGELLERIENKTGRKAIRLDHPTKESSSPYGPEMDRFMHTDRLAGLGFACRPIRQWIGELIEGACSKAAPSKRLH